VSQARIEQLRLALSNGGTPARNTYHGQFIRHLRVG
jgi:hypothetical protein